MAMNQKDVLDALVGKSKYFETCGALFVWRHAAGEPMSARKQVVKGTGMAEAKSCWPNPAMTARDRADGARRWSSR